MQMPGWMASAMLRMGMLAEITVVGRVSGLERTAIVNKAAAPGGGWYVAAGDETHQWGQNLRVAGRCRFTVRGTSAEYVTTVLEGEDRAAAVRAMAPPFMRGRFSVDGPIFRLDPV